MRSRRPQSSDQDEAAIDQVGRLVDDFRLDGGPRALQAVLPLARSARRLRTRIAAVFPAAAAHGVLVPTPEWYSRLVHELRMRDGPLELRLVLPLARLARGAHSTLRAVVPLSVRLRIARLRGITPQSQPPMLDAPPAPPERPPARARRHGIMLDPAIRTVHQFHAGSATGDAITNAMFLMQAHLRRLGYDSEIYVINRDPDLADRLHLIDDISRNDDYALIVRHSMGFDGFEKIAGLTAPKILLYHNITPPEFFADNSYLRQYVELGRRQLSQLLPLVEAALADSEYNALELRHIGFDPVHECPFLFDVREMAERAAAGAVRSARGPFTVIFVGRIIGSKGQADLVAAFAKFHERFEHPSRLVLVGRPDIDGPNGYTEKVRQTAAQLGIEKHVVITGFVSDEALRDWYRAADLYVSLSEHEGFGVPLIEAMVHGVPVLAWSAGAVAYTMGGAGELLHDRTPARVAQAMLDVARRPERRAAMIGRQNERVRWFDLERHSQTLISALAMAGVAAPPSGQANRAIAAHMGFTVAGHVKGTYSLSLINRMIALSLERNYPGRVLFQAMENGPVSDPLLVPAWHRDQIQPLMVRANLPTGPSVLISQHYPILPPTERHDLAFVMVFWEESIMPMDTVRHVNESFDAVLAPSRFVAKSLLDSGVSIPVIASGSPSELDRYLQLGDTREVRRRDVAAPFTFLHVSSCFPRKGVDVLIRAFVRAFRRGDPVRLVIKGFPNPHNDVGQQLAHVAASQKDMPKIEFINEDVNADALSALYRDADAIVLPSRGEGFNLPAAEAMAASIPLIVTANGGHRSFCEPDEARFVDYRFAPAESHVASQSSVWMEPDEDDLVAALRELFDTRGDRQAQARARAVKARAAIRVRLDADTWARNLRDLSADLILAPPTRPMRLGWVSSWNTSCGIATYSGFLIDQVLAQEGDLPGRTVVYADSRSIGTIEHDGLRIDTCWDIGEVNPERLVAAIARSDSDVLVIQHQPGLMNWATLGRLVSHRRLAGRQIVVTLHATARLNDIPAEELDEVLSALGRTSRVLVHNIRDLNMLKGLGLVDNVALFPHGASIGKLRPLRNLNADVDATAVIGCYGFFLPGKGIPLLIKAFSLLRRAWPRARLRLVNAEYPDPLSAAEIRLCRKLVEEEKLGYAVEWVTEFLPNEQSLALLSRCDLIVMPYEASKESASGAARVALASGVPVVVSDIELFAEMRGAVHRVAAPTPASLADTLNALLSDPARRREIQEGANAWMQENSWERVGERLHGMLKGLHASARHKFGPVSPGAQEPRLAEPG